MNFYYDIQFNVLGTIYATLGVVVTSLYQVVSSLCPYNVKVKVKHFLHRPGQAQRVPRLWGSQISRLSAHEGGKVEPYTPATFTPEEVHIYLELISLRG
jgi:hypothetical protein